MACDTMEFATRDVMSVVTGRLMGDIGNVYEVLNWMTGESLFTHQLPRVSREARPVLLERYPAFQSAIDEADLVTKENFAHWRDTWEDRYGPVIAVPRFNESQHERIDALSEAAEHFRPEQIAVVGPGASS